MPERKPIFYDEERRRWRRTRLLLEVAGGLFALVLVIFLLNVGRNPDLPDLLRQIRGGLHAIPQSKAGPCGKAESARWRHSAKCRKTTTRSAAPPLSDDYTSLASLGCAVSATWTC